MKDFEGFIKNYATRDFIYFFAEKSIEIYKNQVEKLDEHLVCNITFPLNIIQHGFIHKQAKVMLSAWDIPRETYTATMQALQKNTMATIRQSSISVIRPEAMVTICSIWSTNTWMSILQTIRT